MDQLTVVRSTTHRFPVHGVAYAVSGIPSYTPDLEDRARDVRHWPYIGSVVDYLAQRQADAESPSPSSRSRAAFPRCRATSPCPGC